MTAQDTNWLKLAEYSLFLGSGAGTVAAVAAQNVAYASAPLTALVALGLMQRGRIEQKFAESEDRLIQGQQQINQRVAALGKQISALPSPEALTNFQRSVMDRSDRSFFRFARELKTLRNEVNQRFASLSIPDVDHIQEEVCQLQEQYTEVSETLEHLNIYVHRLSTLPRVEAVESQVSQLLTEMMQMRVNLEALGGETKTTMTYLQDTVHHFERRLRQLPATLDPQLLREELQEVVKAVTELVPRREFNGLVTQLQALSQRQEALQQALQTLGGSRDKTLAPGVGDPGRWSNHDPAAPPPGEPPSQSPHDALNRFSTDFFIAAVELDLARLTTALESLRRDLPHALHPEQLQAQIQETMADSLARLQEQFAAMESLTLALSQQQQALSQQLEGVLARQAELSNLEVLEQLPERIALTEEAVQLLQNQTAPPSAARYLDQAAYPQWILDFPASNPEAFHPQRSASRRALESALEWAHHRLLLVWPWSDPDAMDEDLVARFQQVLARQCFLEIGWCHRGNRQEGRLLRAINLRWGTESEQLKTLKEALNRLMPLRQRYPEHFKFKILGTDESFLVCDRTFAILGLQSLPTQNTVFPQVGLKLPTTDPEVIHALAQRFENPVIGAQDAVAFFNRGTTRYDLRDQPGAIADYSQVIAIEPTNGVAYNNRGVVRVDLGQIAAAEEDFGAAIACAPDLFAAYCNRGWLRLEQQRYPEAAADFSVAIQLKADSPIPYLYRGSAIQKLGDLDGAIQDYNLAVECSDALALPYFYRSAAYDRQGDRQQAIADLEVAQSYLLTQGDTQVLSSVQRTLHNLKKRAILNGHKGR